MRADHIIQFLATVLGLSVIALILAATVAPPDPFTLMLYVVPLWGVALVLSYLLVYRGGLEHLRS